MCLLYGWAGLPAKLKAISHRKSHRINQHCTFHCHFRTAYSSGLIERNNSIRDLYGNVLHRLVSHRSPPAAELNDDNPRSQSHEIFFSLFWLQFEILIRRIYLHCVAVKCKGKTYKIIGVSLIFHPIRPGLSVCWGNGINLSSFCANANAFPALGVDHSNCTNECAPQWWH